MEFKLFFQIKKKIRENSILFMHGLSKIINIQSNVTTDEILTETNGSVPLKDQHIHV